MSIAWESYHDEAVSVVSSREPAGPLRFKDEAAEPEPCKPVNYRCRACGAECEAATERQQALPLVRAGMCLDCYSMGRKPGNGGDND